MSLPLMPGSEPVVELKMKAPAPQPAQVAYPTGEVPGCGCASCRREYEARRQAEARVVPPTVQLRPSIFNWEAYPEQAIQAAAPPNPNAGRIRGRYDFVSHPESGNSYMQGWVRWREPGGLSVYDEDGREQWTYDEEQPDGTLVSRNGRWYPTEV